MSTTSRHLVWALRFLALAVIGLNLAAPLFTEPTAWGLWATTYLPAGLRWVLGSVAAILAVCGDHLRGPLERLVPARLRGIRFGSMWVRLALASLAAIPLYLFRIRHLRWGDAYILVKGISHPQAKLTYVWQAPLDVFIHAKAWALGNRLFGWPDPIPVYWILSTAAGVVFMWVLLGLAYWLGQNSTERVLLFGLVATLGTMELFFGYIENYSLMTLGVLIYIWLALRTLRNETSLVWTVTALALTNAFHPSTIILAPSLLYVAVIVARRGKRAVAAAQDRSCRHLRRPPGSYWRALLAVIVPYALVLAGVVVLMSAGDHGVEALLGADFPGGGDRRWFVPLLRTSTKWEHYTMFSIGHLLEIVNEQQLIAPVVLPGLVLAAILAWRRLPLRDTAFRLLLLLAASYLLLILTWNPDYGGQRDWDLFAPAALPAAILLAYTLARVLPERGALRAATWALVTTQAFHTVAWIYENTLPVAR